jgi:endonuclease G
MVKKNGQLSATAYLLSQESLIEKNLEVAAAAAPEDFSYSAYRTFQVPVTQVEQLTALSFGDLSKSDPLAGATRGAMGLEAMELLHEVDSHEDLIL